MCVGRMTTGAEGCREWFGRCIWAGEGGKKAGGFCTAIMTSVGRLVEICWKTRGGGRGGRWREGRGRRERGRRESNEAETARLKWGRRNCIFAALPASASKSPQFRLRKSLSPPTFLFRTPRQKCTPSSPSQCLTFPRSQPPTRHAACACLAVVGGPSVAGGLVAGQNNNAAGCPIRKLPSGSAGLRDTCRFVGPLYPPSAG